MHSLLTITASLAALVSRASVVCAVPELSFAVNAQLPPVSYVSQFFEFTFSAQTFRSSSDEVLHYQLSNGPAWLTIDSDTRTLSGTPTIKDIGAVALQIVAEDGEGQVVDNVTLIVLEEHVLMVGEDLVSQLERVGMVSTPAALLLRPLENFSFAISPTTFEGLSSKTQFYAVSSDGSPLPSWLQFNPSSLLFSGTTPPFPATTPSRQEYTVSLAASNVVGFSEAAVRFQIVIETHILAFQQSHLIVNITDGNTVAVPSLLRQLSLDDHQIGRDYLTTVVSSAPDWLSLDDTDLSLMGTAPNGTDSFTFYLSVTGRDSNEANITILIAAPGSRLDDETSFGVWNATQGESFVHRIPRSSQFEHGEVTRVDLGQLGAWLKFNESNSVLYGQVPAQQSLGLFNVSITFVSNTSNSISTFIINVVSSTITASHVETVIQTATYSTVTASSTTAHGGPKWSARSKVSLALKIGLPLICTIILIVSVISFRRYRSLKKRRNLDRSGDEEVPTHGVATIENPHPETTMGEKAPSDQSIPQIRLSWPQDPLTYQTDPGLQRSQEVTAQTTGPDWDDLISPSLLGSEEDIATGLPTIRVPKQRQSTPAGRRRSGITDKWNMGHDVRLSRFSASSSAPSIYATGLPKRLSGAGHGAGINTALTHPDARSSWYTTFGSIPVSNSRRSTGVLTLFPAPPSQSSKLARSAQAGAFKAGSKARPRPTHKIENEPGSFEEARQRYYTERARDQLEGVTRFSNISLRSPSRGKMKLGSKGSFAKFSSSASPPSKTKSAASRSKWSVRSAYAREGYLQRNSIKREASMASSGQFDSAISSDSQWEDEDLTPEAGGCGDRGEPNDQYLTATKQANPEDQMIGHTRMSRMMISKPKPKNVHRAAPDRSKNSHQNSFSFI